MYAHVKLLNCVLEGLGWTELRRTGSRDADGFAGAWVASRTCRASLRDEDTETSDRNLVTCFEGDSDGVDDGFDSTLSVCLGAAENVLNLRDDVCFVHALRLRS